MKFGDAALVEEIAGVQGVVAQEAVERAVQLIGAGRGDDAHLVSERQVKDLPLNGSSELSNYLMSIGHVVFEDPSRTSAGAGFPNRSSGVRPCAAAFSCVADMDAKAFGEGQKTYRPGKSAAVLVPGQPWQEIRALGNRLRHEYHVRREDRLWDVSEVRSLTRPGGNARNCTIFSTVLVP